jgi:L-aminopeptidase/D-esterase-like protein
MPWMPGVKLGHAGDPVACTGCTVVIPERPAVAGVDVRGSAPGTRELEAIRPVRLVQRVDAIVLTGGSAFGLDAACGVQRWLEEQGHGFDTGFARVPIVPAAVIFDLSVSTARVRPDQEMGYRACAAASSEESREGRVGVGLGATVGKLRGPHWAMWGGLGLAMEKAGNLLVGAVTVCNALGAIRDPESGRWIAGPRLPDGSIADSLELLRAAPGLPWGANTTLAVVITNAALTPEAATKVAQMAHDGLARVIYPVHTSVDGDTVFAISVGELDCPVDLVGTLGTEVVARAILSGARKANADGTFPPVAAE